jgi:amino acid adenylation domain-containing protein
MSLSSPTLVHYLEASASRHPDTLALVDPFGVRLSYAELDDQANRVAGFLRGRGVERGDRVGLVLRKSAAAVVGAFGIMKAGAAYVPADYQSPPERNARILSDCGVRVAFLDTACSGVLSQPGGDSFVAVAVPPDGASVNDRRWGASWSDVMGHAAQSGGTAPEAHDLAYILYTSGSTGIPKGVILSHENATSFVDWCSEAFLPTSNDRFSSHAPFHFDLSVLDIYLSVKHGATLYLVGEDLGKSPRELAQFIAGNRLTVWYSTPSILSLLSQFGALDTADCSTLRHVLFAGEVFPVKHLRQLKKAWPGPSYFNLYGPTETNVCTFARIPESIPDDRTAPYPIGPACSHCAPLVLDEEQRQVAPGQEGLLFISGPSVFQGYWNRPAENAAAFVVRDGVRWYNTGDVVRESPDEGFIYLGRRDRMVKRRGYRIELGEIERGLYRHDQVREAAVISTSDESGVRIVAYLSLHSAQRLSIIDLKAFCGKHLPAYMIPDAFVFTDALPRTSTDKVDYQALHRRLASAAGA